MSFRLNDLGDKGYHQPVLLFGDSTPEEIRAAVLAKFSNVPQLLTYGFRPLRVKATMKQSGGVWKKKKGVPALLRPFKASKELNMNIWERYAPHPLH